MKIPKIISKNNHDEWNVKIYADNMEEIINCAHCGKKIKAGDSYTSYEIHNEVGIVTEFVKSALIKKC